MTKPSTAYEELTGTLENLQSQFDWYLKTEYTIPQRLVVAEKLIQLHDRILHSITNDLDESENGTDT